MYRFASNRPQQLFRQLITTSLTAGSLLLMPLIGAASTYNENTDIEEKVPLEPSQTYTISEGVTVSSSLADDDLFITPADDFGGSANTPNFTISGILTHVRDDSSKDSATFRILADNFSLTNATTGQITIGKNYPTTKTWGINGFVFSGSGGILTNEGEIEGQGDYTVVLGGSNNTVTNSGTLRVLLTNGFTTTDSYFYRAIDNQGIENSLTNGGTIESYFQTVYNNGRNFTLYNSAGGLINAAGEDPIFGGQDAGRTIFDEGESTAITNDGIISSAGAYGINSRGDNASITNGGALSARSYTYRVYGNANNLVNSGTISADTNYGYRVTSGADNATLSNKTSGVIEAANQYGVGFWDSTNISVANAGTVKAGSNYAAYFSNDENVRIVNSGKIEAGGDTVVAILGGKNISLTSTGSITSNGTVAISAEDVEGLTVHSTGTITGDINILTGDTAPDAYLPTVTLKAGTLNGNLNFLTYDSSDVTWSQVSKLPTEKSSEQVALEDKIQALEEALQSYAPSKEDGAVPEPLTADLSKEETLELASHAVSEEDSQEQHEKEMQLRQLQSELDTLTEAEVDKAAAVPHDTSTGVGSAHLAVGGVKFGGNSEITIRDSDISLERGFTGSIPFSSESSGNSYSVGSGEDVRVVGLSPAANTITIAGPVGYITTPEGGSYTANLTPSGSIRAIELGGTAAERVNLTIKTTGSGDEGASTTASTALSQAGASPVGLVVVSDNVDNTLTFDSGQGTPYCLSLLGSSPTHTFLDAYGQEVTYYPGQMASFGADNCHTFVAANAGLLDARYDKLSDKIINLDHKLQDGNTDWLFEVRYQDMRQNTDENQPHANSTILALSKLWHTTRGDWIFQASHDSMHIGQHLNNNSASIVLGHSQNWGKTSELHMQLGGDRREMSLNLVGDQETVRESSNYSIVYGEIGMGRVLHKLAGHDINMRMRLAAERIGSIGKGWDSDTIALMIPELSVSGRVLPSLLTDASHRLYAFAQKPIGDTTQKYTITGHSESTLYYDTDVSGGIGYDLHTGVGANTMLHAKASYLNTGYLSLGLGISQNL